MKRHADLHPLSEHHHHVLVLALEIRRAAESSGPEREERLRKLAEEMVRFWDERGRIHFQEEEEVLLPQYARHTRLDGDPEIMRMLADHASIRARMDDIRESLAANFVSNPLIELGRMLYEHVRLEEDHIFPRLEKALQESELNSIGSHLTHLHGEKGKTSGRA